MTTLITAVGVYTNRVITTIAKHKPDKVILLTTKKTNKEYTDAWNKHTIKAAQEISEKLKIFYNNNKLTIKQIDLGDFQECLSFILNNSKSEKILIDITSARKTFEIAAITAGILMDNIKCVYTPAKNPQMPEEYLEKQVQDEGVEGIEILTPKIELEEMKENMTQKILEAINKMNGTSETFVNIMREMNMQTTKSNVIRFSKIINKLEKHGCLTTKRNGREKRVKITPLGKTITELKNHPQEDSPSQTSQQE